MIHLLPPGIFGVLVVSLLAAFMSTIDTHFNWGVSYFVSDVTPRVNPQLSATAQGAITGTAVLLFAIGAVLVAFQRYELQLIVISSASAAVMLHSALFGRTPSPESTVAFVRAVSPLGFWPATTKRPRHLAHREFVRAAESGSAAPVCPTSHGR